jgi:hypothetical protein
VKRREALSSYPTGTAPTGQRPRRSSRLLAGRERQPKKMPAGGPRSGPRRTDRQYPVTGCMPMSVPPTSVPRLAHRPSMPCTTRRPSQQRVSTQGGSQALSPLAGVESCPASLALFDAGGQACCVRSPSRLGPVHLDIRVSSDSPFQFDVTPLAVAGSLPATDRSVQGAPPHLMMPITAPAGPRMRLKSAPENDSLLIPAIPTEPEIASSFY